VRIDAVTVGENRMALGDLCVRYRAITAWLGLRDLAVILKLNFQIFNQLGQPFARKGGAGLQGYWSWCSPERIRALAASPKLRSLTKPLLYR
jgi:hypothetical protein